LTIADRNRPEERPLDRLAKQAALAITVNSTG
jgi:hypothetical protein